MDILVLGGKGQLGQCLSKESSKRGIKSISFVDEFEGNILDKDILFRLFKNEQPKFVINCAAYTAVDKAEDEKDLSYRINCEGVKNIATLCNDFKSTLIHISTDFVFEGNIPKVLSEDMETNPINVYGITKLEGEKEVKKLLTQYYIIRTSWLYSEFANNFVKTMIRLGKERDELGVIIDQVGSPTYAIDLSNAILNICESGEGNYGIYHYSNEGAVSWYDFAKAIFEISKINVKVKPLKTNEYPTKAVRPSFSVMDKSKIKNIFSLEIPYWKDSLVKCIQNL